MTEIDLDNMDRVQLAGEVVRLRNAIRKHRDCAGHDLCWYHPELWSLLPEGYAPKPAVPGFCDFIQNCCKYRQSLEGPK